VTSSPESGDKATRAAPIASQANAGNLSLLRATWNRPFLDELAAFPSAAHDDQVDALSRAFAAVSEEGGYDVSMRWVTGDGDLNTARELYAAAAALEQRRLRPWG